MPKRAKKEKRPAAKIDFKPYGAAIKAGRKKQNESRNKASDKSTMRRQFEIMMDQLTMKEYTDPFAGSKNRVRHKNRPL